MVQASVSYATPAHSAKLDQVTALIAPLELSLKMELVSASNVLLGLTLTSQDLTSAWSANLVHSLNRDRRAAPCAAPVSFQMLKALSTATNVQLDRSQMRKAPSDVLPVTLEPSQLQDLQCVHLAHLEDMPIMMALHTAECAMQDSSLLKVL